MPKSLRPMWAETQREVERAYAGVMTLDQTNDEAAPSNVHSKDT